MDAEDQLESARADVALRGAATLELAVDAGADTAGLLRLAMLPLPPIAAGPSIEISPFVEVRLHLGASADADARISVVAPFRLGSGFAFDGSLRAGMSSSPRHAPEIGLPDSPVALAGSVDLEIILALLIAIEGVPVGGPVIGTSLGTIIEVDPSAVAVNGAVEIVGGWAFLGLDGLPDIPEDLSSCTHSSGSRSPAPVVHSPARRQPGGRACSTSTRTTARRRSFRPARHDRHRGPRTSLAGNPRRRRCAHLAEHGGRPNEPEGHGPRRRRRPPGRGALRYRHPGRPVVSALLMAVDDAGGVEWSIEVDAGGGSTRPAIAALAEAPSCDIIAVGEVDHTDLADPSLPPIDGQNALILRLRPDGRLISGFALGGTRSEKASRVAVASDGSYVIGGHLGSAPNAWLASLRADDSLRWSASYRGRPHASGVDFTTLTGLAAIPDGSWPAATWSLQAWTPGSYGWTRRECPYGPRHSSASTAPMSRRAWSAWPTGSSCAAAPR